MLGSPHGIHLGHILRGVLPAHLSVAVEDLALMDEIEKAVQMPLFTRERNPEHDHGSVDLFRSPDLHSFAFALCFSSEYRSAHRIVDICLYFLNVLFSKTEIYIGIDIRRNGHAPEVIPYFLLSSRRFAEECFLLFRFHILLYPYL